MKDIEIKGLSKVFDHNLLKPKSIALDNIDMSFQQGLCTGVIGHNGAGKTTTIRCILGLCQPASGSVRFRGEPIRKAHRKHFGYMPEANRLARNLTPKEILHSQLSFFDNGTSSQRRERVQKVLEAVGLTGAEKKLVKHLSKGMGRRLAWALATVHNPDIIILDEPFSGMDPLGRLKIRSWILEQISIGKTLILCTHELDTMVEVCHEFYVLHKGKVLYHHESGAPILEEQPFTIRIALNPGEIEALVAKHPSGLAPAHMEGHDNKTRLTFANRSQAETWLRFFLDQNKSIDSYTPNFTDKKGSFFSMFDTGA